MRRHLATAAVALGVLLGAGSGVAAADTPTQAAQQAAGTFQGASSSADSTQVAPSNSAISVRIGSPGSGGSVSQSNASLAGSLAGNRASTSQQATQTGAGSQAVDQSATTGQSASSEATSEQVKPSNSAISVRIGSPGDDGSVNQSNTSGAVSAAGNAADTTQDATQDAGDSCGCHGGSTQAVEQSAKTGQSASSDATSKQIKPSNSAISVRIHSPGDDGSVDQSNKSVALSAAGNKADTTQTASQDPSGSCGCHGGGSTQAAGQFAKTGQLAESDATSKQVKPSNSATSVRIGSSGDDGDVSQRNTSLAGSFAGNAADTSQSVDQEQGSGSGSGVQASDQEAATLQGASSSATSEQLFPSNDATSVRIGSPGDDGSVDQSNTSAALSFAGNRADTTQDATQDPSGSCGCHGGDQVQAAGQFAFTGQWAGSNATSKQIGASNSATPVRIGGDHGSSCGCGGHEDLSSPSGSNGDVSQHNVSLAGSFAGNAADTSQSLDQMQGSGSGSGVQASDQEAATFQGASSDATSEQLFPSNDATSVRIGGDHGSPCGCGGHDSLSAPSGGDDGSVSQLNASVALSAAANAASTDQTADQTQGSGSNGCGCGEIEKTSAHPCGCSSNGVQAAGQFAKTGQWADSSASSKQLWPSNTATPVRIHSGGSNGSVDQANLSLAASLAFNRARTDQSVTQQQ